MAEDVSYKKRKRPVHNTSERRRDLARLYSPFGKTCDGENPLNSLTAGRDFHTSGNVWNRVINRKTYSDSFARQESKPVILIMVWLTNNHNRLHLI